MTAQTPIYGLKYLVEGEPARNTRQALQDNAFTTEAALQAHGLAAPGASDLLAVSGRVTTLETRARATLYAAAAQSGLTAGVWVTITLGGETVDSAGGHAAGAAGYTVQTGQAGDYWVDGLVAFGNVASGNTLGTRILVGSTPVLAGGQGPWASPNGCLVPVAGGLITLAVGNVVTLQGFAGATWATLGGASPGASTSRMSLRRVS